MSVAVCTTNITSTFESIFTQPQVVLVPKNEKAPEQFDIWTSIQAQKSNKLESKTQEPYTHPLIRQSSGLLNEKSLETCTESLGSETGSDNFLPSDHEAANFFSSKKSSKKALHEEKMTTVSKRSSLPRSFPPPLSSILQHDGQHMQMRTQRRDGKLVVDAVSIPSQNCFHAERHNGRLLLSFLNTTEMEEHKEEQVEEVEHEPEEVVEEEEEEEVEVVDRGTTVEVKVSTQQQQMAGKAASMKVHRSSIVINKFVSCISVENAENFDMAPVLGSMQMKRQSATTTTAAAAAVAASSVSANVFADGEKSSTDNKLLFTSKKKNKEELLHDIKRCSESRKSLFIWEPWCIATST